MTILRRNVQELMNSANRNQMITVSPEVIVSIKSRIESELKSRYNYTKSIDGGEIHQIFRFHIDRVRSVTADMSASDLAATRTFDQILSREVAQIEQSNKNDGLSYMKSIEVTRTLNNDVGRGTIRPKKRNISGVTGGVRLF